LLHDHSRGGGVLRYSSLFPISVVNRLN
jgi:hypothetical protein